MRAHQSSRTCAVCKHQRLFDVDDVAGYTTQHVSQQHTLKGKGIRLQATG